MSEKCKTCCKEFNSGIWITPQFNDEKVLLFCSEKCREDYFKRKLEKIKIEYPGYYEKLMKNEESIWENKTKVNGVWIDDETGEVLDEGDELEAEAKKGEIKLRRRGKLIK